MIPMKYHIRSLAGRLKPIWKNNLWSLPLHLFTRYNLHYLDILLRIFLFQNIFIIQIRYNKIDNIQLTLIKFVSEFIKVVPTYKVALLLKNMCFHLNLITIIIIQFFSFTSYVWSKIWIVTFMILFDSFPLIASEP